MTSRWTSPIVLSLLLAPLAACGGPAPAAEAPTAAEEGSGANNGAKDAPKAEKEEADPPAADPAETSEPVEEESAPSKPPSDVLGAPTAAFMLDYSSSDLKERASKKCGKAAGEDLAAKATCMKQERNKFYSDILHFKKEENGEWWFIIYRRVGKALPELYKAKMKFGEETKNSVVIEILGAEKGSRSIMTGKGKFTIKVPNDYSIELEDKKYGKLVYNAKLGLVGQTKK